MRTVFAFQSPVMALVAFGLYMLALLLLGTCTFRSCPEEEAALHEDISRARAALVAQGYNFHTSSSCSGTIR
eukprot:gene4795-5044_t